MSIKEIWELAINADMLPFLEMLGWFFGSIFIFSYVVFCVGAWWVNR